MITALLSLLNVLMSPVVCVLLLAKIGCNALLCYHAGWSDQAEHLPSINVSSLPKTCRERSSLMEPSLHTHHLRVGGTVTEQLELNEHAGAALRGAFFEALWGRFCVNKQAQTCADCPLVNACPVGSLVAPLRDEAPRGRDVPRPYAIRPPVYHARTFTPGEP